MKKAMLMIHMEGTDTYLTIELEDCEDYQMINIEQRDCGTDVTLTEQIVGKKDLRKLRDAIDYIIGDEL